jgi:hypothetical protein
LKRVYVHLVGGYSPISSLVKNTNEGRGFFIGEGGGFEILFIWVRDCKSRTVRKKNTTEGKGI